jgi:hypothetical protein
MGTIRNRKILELFKEHEEKRYKQEKVAGASQDELDKIEENINKWKAELKELDEKESE